MLPYPRIDSHTHLTRIKPSYELASLFDSSPISTLAGVPRTVIAAADLYISEHANVPYIKTPMVLITHEIIITSVDLDFHREHQTIYANNAAHRFATKKDVSFNMSGLVFSHQHDFDDIQDLELRSINGDDVIILLRQYLGNFL